VPELYAVVREEHEIEELHEKLRNREHPSSSSRRMAPAATASS
jgi:hypothetical protein